MTTNYTTPTGDKVHRRRSCSGLGPRAESIETDEEPTCKACAYDKPERDELVALRDKHGGLPGAAKELDVSVYTVRNWANDYDIDRLYESADPGEERLRELYHDQGKTLSEVGAVLGVSGASVYEYMERHGIERRDNAPVANEFLSNEEWLRARLEDGHTYDQIADKAGCSAPTVSNWVQRHGLQGVSANSPQGVPDDLPDLLEGRTHSEVAEMKGVSPSTVSNWKVKHPDVEVKSHQQYPGDEEVRRVVEASATRKEAAEELGCALGTARRWADRAGVEASWSRESPSDADEGADEKVPSPEQETDPCEPQMPDWLDEGSLHAAWDGDLEPTREALGWRDEDGDLGALLDRKGMRGNDTAAETPTPEAPGEAQEDATNKYAEMFVEMTGQTEVRER